MGNAVRNVAKLSLMTGLLLTGCGGSTPVPAALEPPGIEASTRALVASLGEWKSGKRGPGGMIAGKPAVGIVDSSRTDRPLIGFQVAGSLGVQDKARAFVVTLELESPRETRTARYLVLGQDPLWVFAQEDFERVLHWEHAMTPAQKDQKAESSRAASNVGS